MTQQQREVLAAAILQQFCVGDCQQMYDESYLDELMWDKQTMQEFLANHSDQIDYHAARVHTYVMQCACPTS